MEPARDEVGIVAVVGHDRAAEACVAGLGGLVGRGGEAWGVLTTRGAEVRAQRRVGVAPDGAALSGNMALGVRWHLADDAVGRDQRAGLCDLPASPVWARTADGPLALALSGGACNGGELRRTAAQHGAPRTDGGLAEIVLAAVLRSTQRTWVNRWVDALWQVRGAFAGVLLTGSAAIAVRDPWGLRPLVLARIDGATVFCSDEAAADAAGATVVRALQPGEMLVVEGASVASLRPFPRRPSARCGVELVRLGRGADGDGEVDGRRRRLAEAVVKGLPPGLADAVVPADGAVWGAAAEISTRLKLPVVAAVEPGDDRVLAASVRGRRLLLVGTSPTPALHGLGVALLGSGAAEVHVRALLPATGAGCPYGVRGVGSADAVAWGDPAWTALHSAAGLGVNEASEVMGGGVCLGCAGARWPIPPEEDDDQLALFPGAPTRVG